MYVVLTVVSRVSRVGVTIYRHIMQLLPCKLFLWRDWWLFVGTLCNSRCPMSTLVSTLMHFGHLSSLHDAGV